MAAEEVAADLDASGKKTQALGGGATLLRPAERIAARAALTRAYRRYRSAARKLRRAR